MTKRKLIITQNISQALATKITSTVPEWDVIVGTDKNIWYDHLKSAEVIAGWKKEMETECLKTDSKLRWIQSWSAGIDRYPLNDLAIQDILLTSANGVHAFPISETIFALMLSLTRKIHTYVKQQELKKWYHANLSLEMHRKTIGIIGVGAIGKETAKIAKAFGMNVIGVRRSDQPEPFVDNMVTTDHLARILPECDYVVVTLPLTKETKQLVNKDYFKLMKPTSIFINIGRGEVVDEGALINALHKKQIAGAGLDVFTTEPLNSKSPLWNFENVIITPHTAGSTEHYNQRVIEDILIPNITEYLQNKKPPINLVDYTKGY